MYGVLEIICVNMAMRINELHAGNKTKILLN